MKNYVLPFVKASILLFSFFSLTAQGLPEIIPPSPTVAGLMQFEEVPISYYTGQPNISIPIYSKSLMGGLTMNIGLNYNTQGIKLNSYSGWCGTGWSLGAGGSISRIVRGEPDEITKAGSTNKTGALHLNQFWDYDNLTVDQKREFAWRGVGSSSDKYDLDLDLYQFNFMGYTGRFVIIKEGNTLVPKLVTKSQNFKIEFTHNATYEISSFTITDTKGYKYTFGNVNSGDNAVETTTNQPFSGRNNQGTAFTNPSYSAASLNYPFNSAWHLKKVETSNGESLVTLNYQSDYLPARNSSVSVTDNTITGLTGGELDMVLSHSYNRGILRPLRSISYNVVQMQSKKLSSIVFRDGITVDVTTKANDTNPETGGKILDKVSIKDTQGNENKSYTMTYEETIDTSTTLDSYRLWLTKVTETTGSIDLDYKLHYTNKEDLPGVDPLLLGGDAWGYNSGISLDGLNCTNTSNTYSDDIIKAGLLSAIEYPTGGVKEFVFEHNSFSYYQDQLIGYEDYMDNPRNTNIQSQFTDNFVYNHNGQSAPTITIDTFTTNFEQDIFVSSWVTSTPSQYLDDHRIKIYNSTFSVYLELDQQCQVITGLPAGTYTMALAPFGSLNTATYTISGDYRVTYQTQVRHPKQEMIGGGVRIKEVIFKDNLLTQVPEKHLLYSYNDVSNSSISSGVLDAKYDRLEKRYSLVEPTTLFVSGINNNGNFQGVSVFYNIVEKHPNIELTQGSYVGYKSVRVEEIGNGYKTMEYTSPHLYPNVAAVFALPHARPVANLDYKRGLLLKENIYDDQGRILKETSHLDSNGDPNYDFDEDFLFTSRYSYKDDCVDKQFFDRYIFFKTEQADINVPSTCGAGGNLPCKTVFTNCGGEVPILNEDFNSGWAKLKGTKIKEYNYPNNTTLIKEVNQEFTYNNENFQLDYKKSYYKIKGQNEIMEEYFYYPVGTTLGSNTVAMRNRLKDLNMVNEVLEAVSYRNGTKLSETHNIYYEPHTNLIVPKELRVGKHNFAPDKRIEFTGYDNLGNLTEVKEVGGPYISYVYGFDKTLPLAKITNARTSTVSGILGSSNLTGNLSTSQKNTLRNQLPNAFISVFNYDNNLRLVSTSDEKDYSMFYEYDSMNRLKRVKDANGKIMSENNYNYKFQY